MTLSESQPGRPPDRERDRPHWGSPTRPDHLPGMPCPLPRWTQPVYVSVTSRSVQPSLMLWQVGVHDFTFEACSGFTRVTACRVAQPPWVAFVTRLRPGPARRRPKPLVSYQTYRQLSGWDFHPLAIRAVGAHITFPRRPFIFKVSRVPSSPSSVTCCRRPRYWPRVPPTRTPLKRSRQSAVSSRQWREVGRQPTIRNSQFIILNLAMHLKPSPCSSPTYHLRPTGTHLPHTIMVPPWAGC